MAYDHQTIETKWRKVWLDSKLYEPDLEGAKNSGREPYYNLMMFPYPSAEGLHVGNMYAFSGADVWGRYQRMLGNEVLEPIGLDGFGIHSENYAIKIGTHPAEQAKVSQEHFYDQLSKIGNGFAWNERLETYDPHYYKWTQWLFIEMFKKGLAYRKVARVNWCPSCKTVLADEQVEGGKCERCKTEVTFKDLAQWFFRITRYAEPLLTEIDALKWPEKIKIAQRNWIGKSEGVKVTFQLAAAVTETKDIEVFTTRLDTLFGVTFIVVAPEHPVINQVIANGNEAVKQYVEAAKKKTENERKIAEKNKTGVDTGLRAIHPLTKEEIPIWVADFVLMEYGTGAVMGVPAHDERDLAFARAMKLPIKQVIAKESDAVVSLLMGAGEITLQELQELEIEILERRDNGVRSLRIPKQSIAKYEALVAAKLAPGFWNEYVGREIVFLFKHANGTIERLVLNNETEPTINELAARFNQEVAGKSSVWSWLAEEPLYTPFITHPEAGLLVNSGDFTGMMSDEAKINLLRALGEAAKTEIHYHLRDWLISRQRYWGPPIPMIYCESCAQAGKSWFTENAHPEAGDWDSAGWWPVEQTALPVELPLMADFKPKGEVKGPLAAAPEEWLTVPCPHCGGQARRETDVSDTFLDSSWYFLAYPNLHTPEWTNGPLPWNQAITKRWLPVNSYIGGAEHAVLHLLYSRFVWKAFKDWGYFPEAMGPEPFPFLYGHGLIIKDGAKMSKSRGNIVNPDEYIEKYGADTLRTYLMFLGPYDQGGDFREAGIAGMRRFLDKVMRLYQTGIGETSTPAFYGQLQEAVQKMRQDFANFRFNTAIAAWMVIMNQWQEAGTIAAADAKTIVQLFAPIAPYMAEELWQRLNGISAGETIARQQSVHWQPYPEADAAAIQTKPFTVVVQVNGKLRHSLVIDPAEYQTYQNPEETLKDKTKTEPKVAKWLEGKEVKKVIFIPPASGKLGMLNWVVA